MEERITTYDVVFKYKDIKAMQYVCPLIDDMSADEKLRFLNWITQYINQSV